MSAEVVHIRDLRKFHPPDPSGTLRDRRNWDLRKAHERFMWPSYAYIGLDPEREIKLSQKIFWERIRTESGSVEAKLIRPSSIDSQYDKLLLFEPGFPGDGSTRLDKLWAKELADNGFTIAAARHNGTIINGPYSNNYLNCPQRQEQAHKLQGEKDILGEYENPSLREWMREPLVMMEAFVPYFNEVILVGHSFGSLAMLSSLTDFVSKHPEYSSRIKRFISLAGTVGRFDDKGERGYESIEWKPYMDTDAMRARVSVGDAGENFQAILEAAGKIHGQADTLPYIDYLFVVPQGDKLNSTDTLVNPKESEDMIRSLGRRRAYLLEHSREKLDLERGLHPHEVENLDLAALTDLKRLPSQHRSRLI